MPRIINWPTQKMSMQIMHWCTPSTTKTMSVSFVWMGEVKGRGLVLPCLVFDTLHLQILPAPETCQHALAIRCECERPQQREGLVQHDFTTCEVLLFVDSTVPCATYTLCIHLRLFTVQLAPLHFAVEMCSASLVDSVSGTETTWEKRDLL